MTLNWALKGLSVYQSMIMYMPQPSTCGKWPTTRQKQKHISSNSVLRSMEQRALPSFSRRVRACCRATKIRFKVRQLLLAYLCPAKDEDHPRLEILWLLSYYIQQHPITCNSLLALNSSIPSYPGKYSCYLPATMFLLFISLRAKAILPAKFWSSTSQLAPTSAILIFRRHPSPTFSPPPHHNAFSSTFLFSSTFFASVPSVASLLGISWFLSVQPHHLSQQSFLNTLESRVSALYVTAGTITWCYFFLYPMPIFLYFA